MISKKPLFIALMLFILIMSVNTVFADDTTGVTRGTGIQLRDEAVNGAVIKKLNSGIRVKIGGESTGTDGMTWYKVTSDKPELSGYIRSDFVDKKGVAATEIVDGTAFSTGFDDVKINDTPGEKGKTLCRLPYGTVCTIKDAVYDDEGGYFWFKVVFNPVDNVSMGYIRYDYLNIDDYSDDLLKLGFPESYIAPLNTIHTLYPEWVFKAYDPAPGYTFDHCVDVETPISVAECSSGVFRAAGIDSLTGGVDGSDFETTLNSSIKGNRTVTTMGNEEVSVIDWSPATRTTVAYRMDPRNFMVTENGELNRSFFMFLSGTDTEGTNEAGVKAILSTTSMTGDIPGEGVAYSATVYNKSIAKGVNPYLIAARMRQEHGNSAGDDLINGNYSKYPGYYNYFNIQANNKDGKTPVDNGLEYAKKMGWDTRVKSISGGLDHLADNYFLSQTHTQDTLYKQRFFFNTDGSYWHQYMTSIYAPHNEAKNVYEGYKSDTSAVSKGVFLIPVYKDMPATPCPQN